MVPLINKKRQFQNELYQRIISRCIYKLNSRVVLFGDTLIHLYSTANDPQPQMIPRPQMIPKMDRK